MNAEIDAVIMWVDNHDSDWHMEKEKWYKKLNPDKQYNSCCQYQSWDNLHYLFRALEKYLPWLHHIYFITCGHLPSFLNVENPKLKIVSHTDFIPPEYLPTFNPCCIEMNVHRIGDLSENMIVFNDDMFPLMPIAEEYYFQNNQVCDEAVETPIIPEDTGGLSQYVWNMRALNMSVINRHFNKRIVQEKDRRKWFCNDYGALMERNVSLSYWDKFLGFRDPHIPVALKKSTLKKLWELEPDILDRSCRNKFRSLSCVNHWLIRYWQLCEGNFIPRKALGKSFVVTMNNFKEIAEIIRTQGLQAICINENCTPSEFELIKAEISSALQDLLPEKSSFEI